MKIGAIGTVRMALAPSCYHVAMNWLAHIFLSENSIDYQLGNLLADLLKGRHWSGASNDLKRGIQMHKHLDSFTDSHELFHKSKSRLSSQGYLRGIIVDITYDHLLLKNWDRFSGTPLPDFMNVFYSKAKLQIPSYPHKARDFVERVIDSKVLTSYQTFDGLDISFQRVDKRLSRRLRAREKATDYLRVLREEIDRIEDDFLSFFPQLIDFTTAKLVLDDTHWIKR